ncbi:hypothetical protein TNCV_4205711 [Trichonephila clavipes]|nr:hypothetical protein TNCV_4205711 [Trichonephila clavipes]
MWYKANKMLKLNLKDRKDPLNRRVPCFGTYHTQWRNKHPALQEPQSLTAAKDLPSLFSGSTAQGGPSQEAFFLPMFSNA